MRTFFIALGFILFAAPAVSMDVSAKFQDCEACPEMIAIPAGTFVMGSTEEETTREGVLPYQAEAERPQHEVSIPKPFGLGIGEVSVAQYAAFVDETGYEAATCLMYIDEAWLEVPGSSWRYPPIPQDADHPVLCVDWVDAKAYVDWLAEKTGKPYRLPSESEWEYAARAGTTTARYWGDGIEEMCEHANVADLTSYRPQVDCNDGYRYTAPITFGIPNAFGLYGMLGNVGEWVADCRLPEYGTEAPTDGSAYKSDDCETHTGRGGSWWNDAYYIRAARRFNMTGGYHIVGFRVAMDLE